LMADVGVSGIVTIGTMIRMAKIAGIAPIAIMIGLTISLKRCFCK